MQSGPEVLARRPSPVLTNESTGTAQSWGGGSLLGDTFLAAVITVDVVCGFAF